MKQIVVLIFVLLGLAQAGFIDRRSAVIPRRPNVFPQRAYSSRIVNGVPSEIEDHPHHVSVHDTRWNIYFCGGSIIAPLFSLSAARELFKNMTKISY
jgi:hypothetical protein